MDKYLKQTSEKNKQIIYENINNITGLTYIKNFITNEQADELITFIDTQQWNESINRRTIHYNYNYDYKNKNKLNKEKDIPIEIKSIQDIIENKLNYKFNQVIINEYMPGQGIYEHVDNIELFEDTIVSLSLLSNIVMDFRHTQEFEVPYKLLLEKNSLLILQKDARYLYKHGIAKRKTDNKIKRGRRISITFRKVKDNYI